MALFYEWVGVVSKGMSLVCVLSSAADAVHVLCGCGVEAMSEQHSVR